MNKKIAVELIKQELNLLKSDSYKKLCKLVNNSILKNVQGKDGKEYQIEIQAMWDDKPNQDLRILISIDDMGWRAFLPMTESFILSPDGKEIDD